MAKFAIDQPDEKRWQWLGRKKWECFSEADSQKLQHLFLLGSKSHQMWDGQSYRDLDLENMRLLPGRQQLRYALPPPELTLPGQKKKKEKLLMAPEGGDTVEGEPIPGSPMSVASTAVGSPMGAASSSASTDLDCEAGEMPKGLKALVHPCILDMQKPRFAYRETDFQYDYKCFIWQRQLDQAEDLCDVIVCLAKIFAAELCTPNPELPVLGTPNQVMAALCLAFHLAGTYRCPEDRRIWRLSPKAANPIRAATSHSASPKASSLLSPTSVRSRTSSFPDLGRRPRTSTAASLDSMASTVVSTPARPRTSTSMTTLSVYNASNAPKAMWAGPTPLGCSRGSLLPNLLKAGVVSESQAYPVKEPPCYVTFRFEESAASRVMSLKLIKAWQTWQRIASGYMDGVPDLPTQDGDYTWLTKNNESDGRLLRLGGVCATLWHAQMMKPESIGQRVLLLSHFQHNSNGSRSTNSRFEVKVAPGSSAYDTALAYAEKNKRVAATVWCIGSEIGGLFAEGSCAGVEEELCMRSDLFLFLREAGYMAEKMRVTDARGRTCHIPEDGVLGCHEVTVFREGRNEGFAMSSNPIVLPAVICATLVNLNPHQSPSAEMRIDIAQHDKEKYAEALVKKFEMMILACQKMNMDMIVISDQDCKLIHNSPTLLGRSMGKALGKCKPPLPQVILGGTSEFISAAKKTLAEIRNNGA